MGEGVMDNITLNLIKNIVKTKYDDIPEELITEKKKNILDIIGVLMAGTSAEECETLIDLIKYWGGCKESSIAGYGLKTSVHNATTVNCTMARALDFDDVFMEKPQHVNVTLVPTAMSVSEKEGNISGKDFLVALTLGADLQCRLALASEMNPGTSGMSFSYQLGTFGAAAVAGKLMQLNEEQMIHAMGIAYSQMAGNKQCVIDGASTVRLQQGLSAGCGVLSAVLAQRGITGARDPFMGKFGYYNVYQQGKCDVDTLVANLGKKFEGVYHAMKPYPCCMHTHGAIDATLEILSKFELEIKKIEEVEIRINEPAYNCTCEPIENKRIPKTIIDAQFSMPYVVASALIKKRVFLDNFNKEEIKNPDVLKLARERVHPRIDKKIDQNRITETGLKIRMKNDIVHFTFIKFPKGSPQNPMTLEECIAKFSKCSQMGVKPLTTEKRKKVIDMVMNIETLITVNELISLIK
jgi:2-methylcitrate dehydratase PrpD